MHLGPQFWLVAERSATLLAAIASLIAVILAAVTVGQARKQAVKLRESQAVGVLNHLDLLRRRMTRYWQAQLRYAATWPSEQFFDTLEAEARQDLHFADQLQEKAININLKVAAAADVLSQRCYALLNGVNAAKVDWHNWVRGKDPLPAPIAGQWFDWQERLLEDVQVILNSLTEVETSVGAEFRAIDGVPRDTYVRELHNRLKVGAPQAVKALLAGNMSIGRAEGEDRKPGAGLPNRRLKLAGAPAGRSIERLVLSKTRSLTRRLAWCTFAPAA